MAKKTLSFKIEEDVRSQLEAAAAKKQWTLSYYMETIAKSHAKKYLKSKAA